MNWKSFFVALFLTGALMTVVRPCLHAQPVIAIQPEGVTILQGQDAIFAVEATGSPPLTYQWREYVNASQFTEITGATNATLILSNPVPTSHRFAVIVSDTEGSVTSRFARLTVLDHGLKREVFSGIPGSILGDLTNHLGFPSQPDRVDGLATFENPPDFADDYGVRLSGFIVPATESGEYTFYLCANGQAALYLSLDEHPEHKQLIAFEPVGNGSREWIAGRDQASRGTPPQNISEPIRLIGGQAYYVEAIMKAGVGDDNLAVTWQPSGTAPPVNGASPMDATLLASEPPDSSLPTTGQAVSELAAFDREALAYLRRMGAKAGTLAVMKDGRLVLKRGYGWRDRAQTQPIDPDARMRLASISKPVTAATIKELITQGLLATNTSVFPYVGIEPYNGVLGDTQFTNIIVDHLLYHRGGWDGSQTGWPLLFRSFRISSTLGLDHGAQPWELISHELSQPLQFSPGTRQIYSNLGYTVLGNVIERATDEPILSAMKRLALRPWGVRRIQRLRSPEKLHEPDEPFYDDNVTSRDLFQFPTEGRVARAEGGGLNVEEYVTAAGLISSAEDLLRFAQGFHLGHIPVGWTFQNFTPEYASIGERRVLRRGITSSHSGGYWGTTTFLEQRPDGVDWAFLMNKWVSGTRQDDMKGIAERAIASIANWPGDNSTRIELASDAFEVGEEESELVVGVRRTGDSTGEVSAVYRTASGSAQAGVDFTSVTGVVTFADNECAKRITIPILNDLEQETNEIFALTLSDPIGNTTLGLANATVTIRDDDTTRDLPAVELVEPANGTKVPAGVDVALTAAPADPDGAIYTVTFWAGPTLIGEENKPPYTFIWNKPGTGTYHLTARAVDDDGLVSTSDPVALTVGSGLSAASPGTIRRDFWLRRPNDTLETLTNYAFFPHAPTGTEYLDLFETAMDWGDYYGTRLHGWLFPPATGQYVFWIAADEQAQLWLSADDQPANRQMIASVTNAVLPRQWTLSSSQRSAPVHLEAGKRYYIEALHKEAFEADNLAVGWQLPDGTLERPIPGTRLAPFSALPINLIQNPVYTSEGLILSLHGEEGQTYSLLASTNLVDWVELMEWTASADPLPFLDPEAKNLKRRFYRAERHTP